MNLEDLERVAEFVQGLKRLEEQTGLTIAQGRIFDEGEILCLIDATYEIRTI